MSLATASGVFARPACRPHPNLCRLPFVDALVACCSPIRSMERAHWLNSFEFLDKLAERLTESLVASGEA